jgi:TerC family integral membrane protein
MNGSLHDPLRNGAPYAGNGGAANGHDRPRDEFRSSLVKTCWAVLAAAAFGVGLWYGRGRTAALEFVSGYLVEQSLSVDNLFVFIMLFEYFHVPSDFQQRVLSWGIVGAILMRGVMIVAGVAAVKRFRWTSLLFAGILLLSSIKLLMEGDDDDDVGDNLVMRLSRRLVGATSEYDGDRFFTEARDRGDDDGGSGKARKRRPTPLFLCLVCVELSDVVFAVDSIPAVLGISTDPFVVYASNIFAIAGLRALYTLVARAVDSMVYLKPAVCLVLLFISFKMILEYFHYAVSTAVSLGVVVALLAGGAVASSFAKKKKRKVDDDDGGLGAANAASRDDHLRQRAGHAYSAADDLSRVLV